MIIMPAYPSQRAFQVFLLAMSVLVLEVALTRIFSFISFHHFTYLVISIAMLGFGAAGSYLTIRGQDDAASSGEFLARNAWLLGLTIIAAVVIIPRIHFYPMDIIFYGDYSNLLSLLMIVVLTAVPFFFGGTCIGYIISNAGDAINRIYFADLIGAATGCLLAIVLLNYCGGIAACFVIAAIAMAVAALSSAHHRRGYAIGVLATLALAGIIARTEFLPLYVPSDKQMFRMEHMVERIKWHVITRLDVTRPIEGYFGFGGSLSDKYKANGGKPQTVRFIYQDGSNLTGIVQPTPTPRETPSLGYYMQGAPYQLKSDADALVIGCGGGIDMLVALHHGARHVVGVDVNPQTVSLIMKTYKDFAGGVFQRPDVELVVSEGRHFLGRDQRTFDVIQLSGVDTWSALATGAYALTENFIYTAEAFDQYLSHLKQDGILNFSRPHLIPPTETLKLAATALEALERMNIKDSFKHLMIISEQGKPFWTLNWAQNLVKRSPFTREEVRRLADWAESLGYDVTYDPFTPRAGELETLIRSTPVQREEFISRYQLNISPATDDMPFFFQFTKWYDLLNASGIMGKLAQLFLLVSLFQVSVLSALFILYPLYKRKTGASRRGGRTGIFVYFAALGAGFIIIEIALLQKFMIFLGGPAYSMAVTLFTILLSSGIGSFLSRNLSQKPFRLLSLVIPLLMVLILLHAFFIDGIIANLMGLSPLMRGLASVLLIAPLGLLMGMPFPAGLRYVDTFRKELNPWAWGINACATVLGSTACILISSAIGFRAALVIGAAIYLTGWLLFAISQRQFRITDAA
jgi:spermidine synthase